MVRYGERFVILLGLLLASQFCRAEQEPVGYVVEPMREVIEEEADVEPAAGAVVIREGEQIEASEGFAVYAGDVVVTPENRVTQLAMIDDSAITLHPASQLTITDYAFPRQNAPTHVALDHGGAFVSASPRPANARFLVDLPDKTMGTLQACGSAGRASTSKFEIIITGKYIANVAVLKGSVTLSPNGPAAAVDLAADALNTVTIHTTNIPGYTGATVVFDKGNLTPQQIKALKKAASADVKVSTDKKTGRITISGSSVDTAGNKRYVKVTQIGGTVVSSSITIKDKNNKTFDKEKTIKDKRMITTTNSGITITQLWNGTTGVVRITDKNNKTTYTGSATATGNVEVLTATGKGGKGSFTVTTTTYPDGTVVTVTTQVPPGAALGTISTKTMSAGGTGNIVSQGYDPITKTPVGPVTITVADLPPGPPGTFSSGGVTIIPITSGP